MKRCRCGQRKKSEWENREEWPVSQRDRRGGEALGSVWFETYCVDLLTYSMGDTWKIAEISRPT